MAALRFAPRFLFLSADPARVRAQLAGEALALADYMPLRDDISTDEITPLPTMVDFDATLGRYPYTGETGSGSVGSVAKPRLSLLPSPSRRFAQNTA